MLLALWSPKGGTGTSVFAAAVALATVREAREREAGPASVRLADLTGDLPAVLGMGADPMLGLGDWLAAGPEAPGEALARFVVEVAAGVGLLPLGTARPDAPEEAGAALAVVLRDGPWPVVADCGTGRDPAVRACAEVADSTVIVLRPCYLALRRAVHSPLLAHTHGVVVVEEPGRVLGTREITEVLDLPVLARVPLRDDISRAVDAGVITTRLPNVLARPARQLASRIGLLPARRGAAA